MTPSSYLGYESKVLLLPVTPVSSYTEARETPVYTVALEEEDLIPLSIFDEVDDDFRLTIFKLKNEGKDKIPSFSTYKTKRSVAQVE